MNKRIRKKKGLSKITYQEVMSLDYTIAKFILPRLIKFKKETISYPLSLKSFDEWITILDKMIWSFERIILDDWSVDKEILKTEKVRYEEGINLFAKYYGDLWI